MAAQLSDNAWIKLLLPLSETPLSDEQWSAISGKKLPPNARPIIARAITLYRVYEAASAASKTPATTRKLLATAAKQSDQLRKLVMQLTVNPRAVLGIALAMPSGSSSKQLEARRQLEEAAKILALVNELFSTASGRIVGGRTGAHEKSVTINLFVSTLDQIYRHFLGSGLTRSSKGIHTPRDFVKAVFRVAGPKVSEVQIEEAMKRIIKGRGKIPKVSTI